MARKEFTITEDNGKEIKLVVRKPEYADYQEGDRVYAGTVATLVRDRKNKKVLLRQEVEEHLREYQIWTEKDEARLQQLQKEIDDILNKIRKGGDKLSNGRRLCIEAMDKRKEAVRISEKRQVLYNTTVESMAEAEKIDYLIYACVVYADTGKNYWESFEDMKNDKDSQAYTAAIPLVMDVAFGVNNEFEKMLPENRWLKKYGFVNDELQYVDRKNGERVDRDGNPIAKLQAEATKQVQNLIGEIEEEQPFIDDETGKPVVEDKKTESKDKKESKKEETKTEETVTT